MTRTIEIDANNWKEPIDIYNDLLAALGAPRWHGHGVDALIDSMVYRGINEIEAPYIIRITGIEKITPVVRDELTLIVLAIGDAQGSDQDIVIQVR